MASFPPTSARTPPAFGTDTQYALWMVSSAVAFLDFTSSPKVVRTPFSSTTPVMPRAKAKWYSPPAKRSTGNSATGSPSRRIAHFGVSPTRTGFFGFTHVAASRSVSPQSSRSSTPRSVSNERSSASREAGFSFGRVRGGAAARAAARGAAAAARSASGAADGAGAASATGLAGGAGAAAGAGTMAGAGAAAACAGTRAAAVRAAPFVPFVPFVFFGAAGAGAAACAGIDTATFCASFDPAPATASRPSTTMRRPPSVIWSPSFSAPRETFLPLTKVPSALPMSMIEIAPSGATSMTEWMREIFSSSRQRWAEARRPILMISRVNCSVRTSSVPRKTLRMRDVGKIERSPGRLKLQVAGGLHHLLAPVLADADEVRVIDLLARLDVFAVGPLQIALDRVVLEVDDGLLLVLDLGLGLSLLLRGREERGGGEHREEELEHLRSLESLILPPVASRHEAAVTVQGWARAAPARDPLRVLRRLPRRSRSSASHHPPSRRPSRPSRPPAGPPPPASASRPRPPCGSPRAAPRTRAAASRPGSPPAASGRRGPGTPSAPRGRARTRTSPARRARRGRGGPPRDGPPRPSPPGRTRRARRRACRCSGARARGRAAPARSRDRPSGSPRRAPPRCPTPACAARRQEAVAERERLAELDLRASVVTLSREHLADGEGELRIHGVELLGAECDELREIELVALQRHPRHHLVGADAARLADEGLAREPPRLVELAGREVEPREPRARHRILGEVADALRVDLGRRAGVALLLEQDAEVHRGLPERRLELARPLVLRARLAELPLPLERDAQVVVALRELRGVDDGAPLPLEVWPVRRDLQLLLLLLGAHGLLEEPLRTRGDPLDDDRAGVGARRLGGCALRGRR